MIRIISWNLTEVQVLFFNFQLICSSCSVSRARWSGIIKFFVLCSLTKITRAWQLTNFKFCSNMEEEKSMVNFSSRRSELILNPWWTSQNKSKTVWQWKRKNWPGTCNVMRGPVQKEALRFGFCHVGQNGHTRDHLLSSRELDKRMDWKQSQTSKLKI